MCSCPARASHRRATRPRTSPRWARSASVVSMCFGFSTELRYPISIRHSAIVRQHGHKCGRIQLCHCKQEVRLIFQKRQACLRLSLPTIAAVTLLLTIHCSPLHATLQLLTVSFTQQLLTLKESTFFLKYWITASSNTTKPVLCACTNRSTTLPILKPPLNCSTQCSYRSAA